MKIVISNNEVRKVDDGFSSLSPDMQTFKVKARRLIGSNLSKWLKDAGITEENTWEKLQISALELRSWQNGSVSPLASRFIQTVGKLGSEATFEAGFLLSQLCAEGQMILKMDARSTRWDGGYRPQGDALGVAIRP